MTTLLLASASPARLGTLRSAGIEPTVEVSDVDEPALLAEADRQARAAGQGPVRAAEQVLLLAGAKAHDVLDRPAARAADLVLGCDSMLELDGDVVGRPTDAADAAARWRRMRGRSGVLHTGHWLVRTNRGEAPGPAGTTETGPARAAGPLTEAGATSSTVVRFADLTDAEIDAYVATGEPLRVAGAFTVDGLGGPFVTGIDGDYHGVVGLSLPLLRDLLGEVGVALTDLWAPRVR
ncbi:MAG: Maf family nucleotide pyrophosphatase [Georgenia sp.]